jgi:hypothetical protein
MKLGADASDGLKVEANSETHFICRIIANAFSEAFRYKPKEQPH